MNISNETANKKEYIALMRKTFPGIDWDDDELISKIEDGMEKLYTKEAEDALKIIQEGKLPLHEVILKMALEIARFSIIAATLQANITTAKRNENYTLPG